MSNFIAALGISMKTRKREMMKVDIPTSLPDLRVTIELKCLLLCYMLETLPKIVVIDAFGAHIPIVFKIQPEMIHAF